MYGVISIIILRYKEKEKEESPVWKLLDEIEKTLCEDIRKQLIYRHNTDKALLRFLFGDPNACSICDGDCKRTDIKFCPICGKEKLHHSSWSLNAGDSFECQSCLYTFSADKQENKLK
jgi:hypothetical protein